MTAIVCHVASQEPDQFSICGSGAGLLTSDPMESTCPQCLLLSLRDALMATEKLEAERQAAVALARVREEEVGKIKSEYEEFKSQALSEFIAAAANAVHH